ncbi:hypothetical protein HMPREF1705_04738 [Acetomicrobium hydrogeniformans ATCC BAA-1850]|uniref:Uncharacterized protein n=1 Tax=Acetomicrobium hydrogeniformans ATCC BAA-1850 TaxID=592015 RepID=A0A0T5X915_9BACT|nr:hypothetical protein HMPREF1705_04738 [Acetomicrobium hydrogeniformans ATCC BAA-1850]
MQFFGERVCLMEIINSFNILIFYGISCLQKVWICSYTMV